MNILVIGSQLTGKTSLCQLIAKQNQNKFCNRYICTTGIQTYSNFMKFQFVLRKTIETQCKIIDSSGLPRFRIDLKKYIQTSDVVIFMFSIRDSQSFQFVEQFLEMTNYLTIYQLKPHCQFFLFGNKMDLKEHITPKVMYQYIQKMQQIKNQQQLSFIHCHFGNLIEEDQRQCLMRQIYKILKRGLCLKEQTIQNYRRKYENRFQ